VIIQFRWLAAALMFNVGATHAQSRTFAFSLERGQETKVCLAYLDRLNRTEFANYPFCGRPEDRPADGFVNLKQAPLDTPTVEHLYDAAKWLIDQGDTEYLQKLREYRRQRGLSVPTSDGPHFARESEALVKNGGQPLFSRLEPQIDIDNDGVGDDVITWKQTGITCGETFSPVNGNTAEPVRAGTYLLVLDSDGEIDAAKSKGIIEHPAGDSYTYTDAKGESHTISFSGRIRKLGYSYGAFVYEGITYFDTFYNSTGDYLNGRVDEPGVTDVLAVLKRSSGATDLVCEIRWNSAETAQR